MFSRAPTTGHDVVKILEQRYDEYISSGQFQPFLYPWGTVGAAVVLAYLAIDHRQSRILERCRYLAFAFIFGFAGYSVLSTKARNPAAAFGVGLISGWSILWCSVLLVFNDAQTDFLRIERKEAVLDQSNGSIRTESKSFGNSTGHDAHDSIEKSRASSNGSISNGRLGSTQGPAERKGTFAWQSYPRSPFLERLDWVADVFCNFRGMGWNWRLSGLPPPPEWVQEELKANSGAEVSDQNTHISKVGTRRYHDKSPLLRHSIYLFCRNYLILDLLKTLIAHDPYFWGIVDTSIPPGYLPTFLQSSPVLTRIARLTISLLAINKALEFIFALGPLFFVGLLGPDLIGARGEPWMYPDQFGSFSIVLDKGLAGWWGGWWHQTFRFAFEAPSKWAIEYLNLNPKSQTAKMLQLVLAFTLSGFLHACGSYTQIGDTRPIRGPFSFFVLQIMGITAQMQMAAGLRSVGITQKMPRWVRKATNFVYVHVWFYYTAPLLCDDFARGGVWLFEPIPISLLRGLGLGSFRDGWWCWHGRLVEWHRGQHWWDTGLSL